MTNPALRMEVSSRLRREVSGQDDYEHDPQALQGAALPNPIVITNQILLSKLSANRLYWEFISKQTNIT